jgi:hypothetical protein
MNRFGITLICVAIAAMIIGAASLPAQQTRVSPHETISAVIDGNRVTIVYGRPFTKDPKSDSMRKIWGTLVPYDKVWRLGSDEATMLITQQPIMMGATTVPAGAYTLYMLPTNGGPSKLIINKQLGQWGLTYDEKQDLARVDLKMDSVTTPVNQLTLAVERNPSGGGILKVTWEQAQFSLPFTVKK